MTATLARLAFVELRSRKLQTFLTLAVITVAAAALALALDLRTQASNPWQRTFDATHGAHVWVIGDRLGARLERFARLPGVSEATAVSYVNTSFVRDRVRFGLALAVRHASPQSGVDRPFVTAGAWGRTGTIVIERSFARRLGAQLGDTLRVATTRGTLPLRIAGIAVTSGRQGYPRQQPGLAWTTAGTLARVQPDPAGRLAALGVRLEDPDAIGRFVAAARPGLAGAHVVDWRSLKAAASLDTRDNEKVLSTEAVFLLLAAGLILATLVTARVLAQSREIGLLKAVGLTPRQVTAVYLVQYLIIGLAGAVAGLAIGRLLVSSFIRAPSDVLGAAAPHAVDVRLVGSVLLIVEAVVAVFAVVPSRRAARRTTTAALTEALGRGSAGRSRLARVAGAGGLPPVTVAGVKDSLARPGRALVTAVSLALTVAVLVAVLNLESSWRDRARADATQQLRAGNLPAPPPFATIGPRFGGDPTYDSVRADRARLRPVVYGAMGILVLVGILNLLATAILGVGERTREYAILKAIGMTPRQVGASVLWTHSTHGVLAAAIGIPLGLLTYRIVGDTNVAPWWWLALVAPAATLACIVATIGPAWRAASGLSVSAGLRME